MNRGIMGWGALMAWVALLGFAGCLRGGECAGATTVEITNTSAQPLRVIVHRSGFAEECDGDRWPVGDYMLAAGQTVSVACGGSIGYTPSPSDLIDQIEIRDADDATLVFLEVGGLVPLGSREVRPGSSSSSSSCRVVVDSFAVDESLWGP